MLPPSLKQHFQDCLGTAEKRAQVLTEALLAGQADLVAVATQDLQQATMALSTSLQALQQRGRLEDPDLKHRLRSLGRNLAQQREACLRRSAVVERSLNSIVPSTRASTYAGGAGPYGRQARRSGAFGQISA